MVAAAFVHTLSPHPPSPPPPTPPPPPPSQANFFESIKLRLLRQDQTQSVRVDTGGGAHLQP